MSFKSLNHLRVVIHINKQNVEDENVNFQRKCFKNRDNLNINGQEVSPASPPACTLQTINDVPELYKVKAEVLLRDDKALQLNLISTEDNDGPYTIISHKMYFDHVSHSSIDMIKSELAIVMDDLVLKQKNTCIMRFVTKEDMDLTIFFDLLITFLNKRIYHQKYKLQYITLECLDIAAGTGDSKHRSEKGFAMRDNLAGLVDNGDKDFNNNDATFKLSRNAKNEFFSTRDLLLWLLNEYRIKFPDSKAHEKLQFSFSIVDHHENVFKVKLSVFNIFLNFMNTEDRNHWHRYMDHMGEGCQDLDCNFIQSGLTISLSSHIEGIASQKVLLLFDVPTKIKMAADTIEMLQMAHSVIKNKKRKLLFLSKNVNLNHRLYPFSSECTKCLAKNHKAERLSLPVLMERQSKRISSLMPNNINQYNEQLCNSAYSSKDLNTLSDWYRKIDECFEKNCQLSEKYFSRYFNFKSKQIASNIKSMYKSLESFYSQQHEQDIFEVQEEQIELHDLYERYHNIRKMFRQLSEDIKGSDFEQVLKVYLETKTFDFNNHATDLKEKQLELCQQHLKFTFDNLCSM